ncbi:MAG: hydrogenase maturation nickel metallochaperone HypA [Xanthomonadales bacterium]|nr:hydrogenase maturation nickel metallochaperone HypA [Xanthomonadales bacterium]MDH4019880.1 hydrogenase maturation nickel metallochaperone HypA [Xanthomonadales bacterium]
MHEMSICQALMDQVERIASEKGASLVDKIVLSIGPLAGVEPELLSRAYEISRAGTVAENAELEIETGPIVVECRSCGASGEAQVSRLVCPSCDDWQVNLTQGDELLLLRLEVSGISDSSKAGN